jgi:hypothetical protein
MKEGRFTGKGIWFAKYGKFGWPIRCRHCGAVKDITYRHGHSMAPAGLIKRLTIEGWYIARREQDDVCPLCRASDRKKLLNSKADLAKRTLREALIPPQQVNGSGVTFDDVVKLTGKLTPDQAKILAKTLRDNAPPKPPKKIKVAPIQEPEEEYQKWLNEQN